MGLFSFLSPLTPLAAAEELRDLATSSGISEQEEYVARAVKTEAQILVRERILFRMSFTEASVSYFNMKQPHPKIRETYEHLERMFVRYIRAQPSLSESVARELWAKAREDYIVRTPEDLAARMMTNIHNSTFHEIDIPGRVVFLELVGRYARDTMTRAGELTKKLRE